MVAPIATGNFRLTCKKMPTVLDVLLTVKLSCIISFKNQIVSINFSIVPLKGNCGLTIKAEASLSLLCVLGLILIEPWFLSERAVS